MNQKALETGPVCFHIGLRSGIRFSFVKIRFFIKVEMFLRFHKIEISYPSLSLSICM